MCEKQPHLLVIFRFQNSLHALQSEVIGTRHDGQIGSDTQLGVLLRVLEGGHDGVAL